MMTDLQSGAWHVLLRRVLASRKSRILSNSSFVSLKRKKNRGWSFSPKSRRLLESGVGWRIDTMARTQNRAVARVVGVLTSVVITTVLVTVVDLVWPEDGSRFLVGSRWVVWAAVLVVMHLVGGLTGGAATAALGRGRPITEATWVAGLAFVILCVPASGAFDRPVELASMVVLNVITVIGVFAGAALAARVRDQGQRRRQ
jgi:hypothetical protein